ncbi:unnamed protein product, partial [Ectocarpus sp. 4 AP-2014]
GGKGSSSPAASSGGVHSDDPPGRHGNSHDDGALEGFAAGKRKRQHTGPEDKQARLAVPLRKENGASSSNTFPQPAAIPKLSSSVEGEVEPRPEHEVVGNGDEQQPAASKSH